MDRFFKSIGIQLASLLAFGLVVSIYTNTQTPMSFPDCIKGALTFATTWGVLGSPVLLISSILHAIKK